MASPSLLLYQCRPTVDATQKKGLTRAGLLMEVARYSLETRAKKRTNSGAPGGLVKSRSGATVEPHGETAEIRLKGH